MRPIGGYFEWEFPITDGSFPHSDGILLNSGRHSLEYILMSLGQIKRLWIPYFTCDVVLQPLHRLGVSYSFYNIKTNFTLAEEIELGDDEYLIYTNYFGIMDEYCEYLANIYGDHLILDYAQSFFSPHIIGINTYYSPRKFVGIPDGGIAYTNHHLSIDLGRDHSYSRCAHLLKRHELEPMEGFSDFKESSHQIANSPLSKMSSLTQKALSSLEYSSIVERRINNFTFLHTHLANSNEMQIPPLDSFTCPMVYPYYTNDSKLRKRLIANQVFVATYWSNVLEWCSEDTIEYNLTNNVLPIPIDQRYGQEEIQFIVKLLKSYNAK